MIWVGPGATRGNSSILHPRWAVSILVPVVDAVHCSVPSLTFDLELIRFTAHHIIPSVLFGSIDGCDARIESV